LALDEVPPLQVAEGDRSLVDNAMAKAQAYARRHAQWAVATDGGLDVPALGARWNPVLTGRAGPTTLLALMRPLAGLERTAFQRECVVVVDAIGLVRAAVEVVSEPRLVALHAEATSDGFWLPGVLRYGPAHQLVSRLSPAERAMIDDHWLALRERLRAVLVSLAA
jgi:hypothetical protein